MRKLGWIVMTVLALLVAIYAIASATVASIRGPFVADLFANKPLRSFGHLAFGGSALTAGAVQFHTGLRIRRPDVHRLLGRVYFGAVLVSGVSAVVLAPSSTGGVAAHFGFGMLGVLWVATTVTAVARARAGRLGAHRQWMIRSYALCLAAVTLRLYLPFSQVIGIPFNEAYAAISWLCWVPNLVVAEWFLVRSAIAPLKAPQATASP